MWRNSTPNLRLRPPTPAILLPLPKSFNAIQATRAAYNTRGVVYAKLGKYSNAIEDFSHTIELDPHFSGAYTNRALAYRQTKKDDLAMQDFNQAISVNANDAAAYLGRGNLERAHGDYPSALNDLNQAIRLNPEGRKPIMRAVSSINARATTFKRSPISTMRLIATRSRARRTRPAARV